jgi:hypothetical protein
MIAAVVGLVLMFGFGPFLVAIGRLFSAPY